ncbi:MAG: hypothetical protein COV44_04335 [Deltaproteobacteria bacterium CG11_big_fil_rev_8_21_14_0_20_45_16]|nr:MAG: hypothetical protein COV44_04335 [Deltaproteobacteria bacterium CG11_big_fil_rev_8_21_14_0_20_45_16]
MASNDLAKLSICLIVRDEESLLEACLSAIPKEVGEIIVVDTGSKDRTREIASRFHPKLYDFEWCDNFAAARNFAASKATRNWILFIDADEIITPPGYQDLIGAMHNQGVDAYDLIERNYTNDLGIKGWRSLSNIDDYPAMAAGFSGFYDSKMVKLYRNYRGLRWERSIHETLEPSCRQLGCALNSTTIVIHHLEGLKSSKQLKNKSSRYLRAVLKKLQSEPRNAAYWFEAALEFTKNGFLGRADKAYQYAIRFRRNFTEALFNLALLRNACGEYEAAERILQSLRTERRGDVDILSHLSTSLLYQGKWSEAREITQQVLQMNPNLLIPHMNAGVICFELGELEKSRHHFEIALRLAPHAEFAAQAITKIDQDLNESTRP